MNCKQLISPVIFAACAVSVVSAQGICPPRQTFSEEFAEAGVAVVAKLVRHLPLDQKSGLEQAQFEVVEVLQGTKTTHAGDQLVVSVFGDVKPDQLLYLRKLAAPQAQWGFNLHITPQAQEYLSLLSKLSRVPAERARFFSQYVEDQDELIRDDAFLELQRLDYAAIQSFAAIWNHDQLVGWIQNHETPFTRRRLYFNMLSVCGSDQDWLLLEEILKSTEKRERAALDAGIACYLTLKGEPGLQLVEELFLKNKAASLADTYCAVVACRFQLHNRQEIKRERLGVAFKHLLQRPDLADLVIPDLAALEDWSVADELFELFKNSTDETKWIRVPVIRYLRKCPLPAAVVHLKECERIDPVAFNRAMKFAGEF